MDEDALACELDKLRLVAIASDPTVLAIRSGNDIALIESELLYLDRSVLAGDDDRIIGALRDAGGTPVSHADWGDRQRRLVNPERVEAGFRHLHDELSLQLWDLRAARDRDRRFNIFDFIRRFAPEGERRPVLSPVTVFTKAPNHWGPWGPPTPAPPPDSLGTPHRRPSIRLAVLDTGIPANFAALHPHLSAAVLAPAPADVEQPYVDQALTDLADDAAHGLFIVDVAYRLSPSLLPVDVRRVGRDDSGLTFGEQEIHDDLVNALNRAAGEQLIVNMSFSSTSPDDFPPTGALARLMSGLADQQDILFVVAAGNNGDDQRTWPAAFPFDNVVSVGALNADNHTVAPFSNRGDWVDCWAVGSNVTGAYIPGRESPYSPGSPTFPARDPWASWQGTSFAAPRVAAAIANQIARMPAGTKLLAAWQQLRDDNQDNHPTWDAQCSHHREDGFIVP